MVGIQVPAVCDGLKTVLVAGKGPADRTFARAAIDSREVQRGDLFFAIRGEREDGHDFVAQALAASKSGCRALSVRSSRAFIGRDGICCTIDEGGDG